ncbi:MAG: hypothetical protein H0T76_23995 [Nannocystis sp.]|nr:GON domain-containing protein [Nannocystis sp.]MBA3549550.1 hypothetical protein [Nannocystis sp.]
MDTDPVEYLPLVNVQEGRNFSHYRAGNNSPGTDVRTSFTHLRIDPITLLVDIDDFTFSSSIGALMHGEDAVTSMPYAVAESCDGQADGVANVDLVGTPFKLKESFCTAGFVPVGGAVLGMNDQVADITGGGGCGWSSPSNGVQCTDNPQKINSGFVLDLEYTQGDAYDQAAKAFCENHLQCLEVYPDLADCIVEWQGPQDRRPRVQRGAHRDQRLPVDAELRRPGEDGLRGHVRRLLGREAGRGSSLHLIATDTAAAADSGCGDLEPVGARTGLP